MHSDLCESQGNFLSCRIHRLKISIIKILSKNTHSDLCKLQETFYPADLSIHRLKISINKFQYS